MGDEDSDHDLGLRFINDDVRDRDMMTDEESDSVTKTSIVLCRYARYNALAPLIVPTTEDLSRLRTIEDRVTNRLRFTLSNLLIVERVLSG